MFEDIHFVWFVYFVVTFLLHDPLWRGVPAGRGGSGSRAWASCKRSFPLVILDNVAAEVTRLFPQCLSFSASSRRLLQLTS